MHGTAMPKASLSKLGRPNLVRHKAAPTSFLNRFQFGSLPLLLDPLDAGKETFGSRTSHSTEL
jgi:hypothetical protein